MVEMVTVGKPLPDEVLEQIIEKTDGVPLFVEEFTRSVLESGSLIEKSGRYVATNSLGEIIIPATLHDSLMARLDRLGAVKEVAQTASAIGREFDYDLLASVSPLSFEKLRVALNELIDAELVFRRGRSEEGSYIFKHALVQDAAYGSQLKSKRQKLHERIAKMLQDRFPERVESKPELLAHHLTEAGMIEIAIKQWQKAGLRSLDASANAEAASHLKKALGLLREIDTDGERVEEELSLQMPLAAACMAIQGWTGPETIEALFRSRELCYRLGDMSQTIPVLYGVWAYHSGEGSHEAGLEVAQECLELAERDGGRTSLLAAHAALGSTSLSMGRLDAAHYHLEKSIALHRPEEDKDLWQTYASHPAMEALGWHCWGLWARGFPEQALSQSHEAAAIGRQSSDLVGAGFLACTEACVSNLCGVRVAARELAQATIDFCTERGVPAFYLHGVGTMGMCLVEDGSPEEGVSMMRSVVAELNAVGAEVMLPYLRAFLVHGFMRLGDLENGLTVLDEAFEQVARTEERLWEAELHRLRGTFLLSLSSKNTPEIEACFQRAINVAQAQKGKSFELRAATNLAQLYLDQGKHNEAR